MGQAAMAVAATSTMRERTNMMVGIKEELVEVEVFKGSHAPRHPLI
jgi:hypothetical protein